MAGNFWLWSQTAATNGTADSSCPWPEGMAPSQVNDSSRGNMAAIASFRDDLVGVAPSNVVKTVAGSATAYTLSTNTGWASLLNGMTITFKVGTSLTNTGACTLNVDSRGAKQIRAVSGTNLAGGELVAGSVYAVTYHQPTDEFVLHNYHGSRGDNVGDVKFTARSSAPGGWLLCAGQAVSRTTFAALFSAISTTYGAGNGTTTFNVPDIRGRVIAGKDNMEGTSANRLTDPSGLDGVNGDVLGGVGGDEISNITIPQLPVHVHSGSSLNILSDGNHNHNIPATSLPSDYDSGDDPTRLARGFDAGTGVTFSSMLNAGLHTHDVSGNTGSTGSGAAHNNVQPTIILNAIIRH